MRTYRDYNPGQQFLLPPCLQDWVPESHLSQFLSDVVDDIDLGEFYASYEQGDGRGQPPYHPLMMVKLILYAYLTGTPSSRKIEEATYIDVAFRVLTANQHPDHDSIAAFRERHLGPLARLFVQVLQICSKVGLVKMGHVALDGTKIKANASKHKAMSYERMCQAEERLEKQILELLQKAEKVDQEEDIRYGKGKRGDELPDELAHRQSRLKAIREGKRSLEEEAREEAIEEAAAAQSKIERRKQKEEETGKKTAGRRPKVIDPEKALPRPGAQRNFTDPESRIMKDGATKSYEQAYNAQAVVDAECQIILAAAVTDEANDKRQLVPMVLQAEANMGHKPEQVSADSGYFNAKAITDVRLEGIELYVAADAQKDMEQQEGVEGEAPAGATTAEAMRHKLKTDEGRAAYSKRKITVEPVFGQIKEARGFRRFSFRGKEKVGFEWELICLTHNLLKLFRSGKWKKGVGRPGTTRTWGAVALKVA